MAMTTSSSISVNPKGGRRTAHSSLENDTVVATSRQSPRVFRVLRSARLFNDRPQGGEAGLRMVRLPEPVLRQGQERQVAP
jgi:hypothetical protein